MRMITKIKGTITASLIIIAVFGSAFYIKSNSTSKDCVVKKECPKEIIDIENNFMLWESLHQQFISVNIFN